MESMIDKLMQQIEGESSRISQKVGGDEEEIKKAIPDVMALLTGALARNSERPEEARSLLAALDKDHDGSVMDDLPGFLEKFQDGPGDGILKHVLGGKRQAAEQQLSRSSGLDMGSISRLLTMLAPLLMGSLGRNQRQNSLDVGGLAGLLGGERQAAERRAPGAMGMIHQLLDADGDGDITDDVVRIGGGFLSRLFKKRK